MSWSSPKYLQQCEKIKQLGMEFPIRPGCRVARGFADLGIEEFQVYDTGKMVSLLSGERTEITDSMQSQLHVIPSENDLVEAISQKGFDVVHLAFVDQREWKISIENIKKECTLNATGKNILETFAAVFIQALENGKS